MVNSPLVLQIVPESVIFKPGLPLSLLVLAQTPDKQPSDATVALHINYTRGDFGYTSDTKQVVVKQGLAEVQITPPADAISLNISANSSDNKVYVSSNMQAAYSPTGNFIHLQQLSQGTLKVGTKR